MSQNLRLIYITNDPVLGQIVQRAGVDWIFVDLEYRGKSDRQANRDTVISSHSIEDIKSMRQVITSSKLMVRINPWGEWSADEIEKVLAAGADIIMLPFFTTAFEVAAFIKQVDRRAKTCLLLETLAGIENIDEILSVTGIDFMHIGLNDLHIERGSTFMFEFLADGGVDAIATKLQAANITFGFGGMARIGSLIPPAEHILAEHFRIGSTGVILSRSFCHPSLANSSSTFEAIFNQEVAKVREEEARLFKADDDFFECTRLKVIDEVALVVQQMREQLA